MRTIETTVFKYDELDDKAKARAVNWFRECEATDFNPAIEEQLGDALDQLGFYARHNTQWALHDRGSEGASFEGWWAADELRLDVLIAERPTDTVLHGIGAKLMTIMLACPTRLAQISRVGPNRRVPAHRADVRFADRDTDSDSWDDDMYPDELAFAEFVNEVFAWMHKYIEAEYDYLTSDDACIESIEVNDYTFNEVGKRV
jgi:hypothetical protein